jgi:hypothetical protein
MSTVLKVRAARMGKMFGREVMPGEDLTADFDPSKPDHMMLLQTGGMRLVKEISEPAVKKTDRR